MKVVCTVVASVAMLGMIGCTNHPDSQRIVVISSGSASANKSKMIPLPDWGGSLLGGVRERPVLRELPQFLSSAEAERLENGQEIQFARQYLPGDSRKSRAYSVKIVRERDLLRYEYETGEFIAFRRNGSTFGKVATASGHECWDDTYIGTARPAVWTE